MLTRDLEESAERGEAVARADRGRVPDLRTVRLRPAAETVALEVEATATFRGERPRARSSSSSPQSSAPWRRRCSTRSATAGRAPSCAPTGAWDFDLGVREWPGRPLKTAVPGARPGRVGTPRRVPHLSRQDRWVNERAQGRARHRAPLRARSGRRGPAVALRHRGRLDRSVVGEPARRRHPAVVARRRPHGGPVRAERPRVVRVLDRLPRSRLVATSLPAGRIEIDDPMGLPPRVALEWSTAPSAA